MTVVTMIYLILCHAGPADHFHAFSKELSKQGIQVKMIAAGPAAAKLESYQVDFEKIIVDGLNPAEQKKLALEVAKKCSSASIVITDVGHIFDLYLHQAFAKECLAVKHFSYYDNPEPYVPGGYSEVASQVMMASDKVLFANAKLIDQTLYKDSRMEIPLSFKQREAVGFYPIAQAEQIKEKRKNTNIRNEFFSHWSLNDEGQKVLVYFGGNNDEYFHKAFPAFLSILKESDLSNAIIVLQQHPGAKKENYDGKQLEEWEKNCMTKTEVIISDYSSSEIQLVADIALYYQTSMGPQFILAGIPTIQIGHHPFEDVLVKNKLAPSVTQASEFLEILQNIQLEEEQDLSEKLGIRKDWIKALKTTIGLKDH